MTNSEKIDTYILKYSQWSQGLETIRGIFQGTELIEEIKWGSPTYTLNGTLVAGMAAFKNHFAIWFHQGFFLKDTKKKLLNAQEGKTKAMRQWRFQKGDPIEKDLILTYILEAIENCKAGKKIKPLKKTELSIPETLKLAFSENSNIKTAFSKLTSGKQREFAEFISEAKKEETRLRRLEKCIPLILEGKGLHDKYENC